MTFSVYLPPHADGAKLPVVWYLSGLTCTHANVTEKGEFRRACAEIGLIFVAPDTSPRGEGVPDDAEGAYDFGLGAGFYVDATQAPFDQHYRMWTYITEELPASIAETFPADMDRQSILGHSMGGHGALTIALNHPNRFKAVSAFAPIVAPSQVPWGEKALTGYVAMAGERLKLPVRAIHSTASMSSRLPLPLRPGSVASPRHCGTICAPGGPSAYRAPFTA